MSALILSAQFWPAFREDRLRLCPEWQQHLDRYTNIFEKLKGNRTLHWKPQLGTVAIEIEFCGRTFNMEVCCPRLTAPALPHPSLPLSRSAPYKP